MHVSVESKSIICFSQTIQEGELWMAAIFKYSISLILTSVEILLPE